MQISVDLGHIPSVLEAFRNPHTTQRLANALAESYNDDIHDWIGAGSGFTSRTGELGQNINWRPVGGGVAEVYANKDYARYVEEGTGIHVGHAPWVIGPRPGRRGVAFPVSGGGGYIVRRSVIHKGSRPHPFFFADQSARGAHMREKGLSVLAQVMAGGGGA